MLDLASALGLEIKNATLVRSNIAVIVILDCTISFLLVSRSTGIQIHRIIAEVKKHVPKQRYLRAKVSGNEKSPFLGWPRR